MVNKQDLWKIDYSAGRPILVYNECSVIESEQAWLIMRLLRKHGLVNRVCPSCGDGTYSGCDHDDCPLGKNHHILSTPMPSNNETILRQNVADLQAQGTARMG